MSVPSGRIVTVRTRLGSFADTGGVPAAGAPAFGVVGKLAPPMLTGATGAGSPTRGDVAGVLTSTGCSSRETTRSPCVPSPTRSWITLPGWGSPADTTLLGEVSAVMTGGDFAPPGAE